MVAEVRLRGSIASKVLGGVGVRVFFQTAVQFVNLAFLALLLRLLSPSDFGVVAMTSMLGALVGLVGDLGLGASLVHSGDEDDALVSSLFCVMLLCGFAASVLVVLLAGPFSIFVGDRRVIPVLLLSSLNYPVLAAGGVPFALLQRRFRFVEIEKGRLLGALAGGIAAVASVGMMGAAPACLVVQALVRNLVTVACYFIYSGWRPVKPGAWSRVRSHLSFGSWVLLFDLVSYARADLDSLLLGKYAGAEAAGLYSVAKRLAYAPVRRFAAAVTSVTFPAFAAMREDASRLFQSFLRSSRTLWETMILSAVFLSVEADIVLRWFAGAAWTPAVWPFRLLLLAGAFSAAGWPTGSVFLAAGRPRMRTLLAALALLLLVSFLYPAASDVRLASCAVLACEALVSMLSIAVCMALLLGGLTGRRARLGGGVVSRMWDLSGDGFRTALLGALACVSVRGLVDSLLRLSPWRPPIVLQDAMALVCGMMALSVVIALLQPSGLVDLIRQAARAWSSFRSSSAPGDAWRPLVPVLDSVHRVLRWFFLRVDRVDEPLERLPADLEFSPLVGSHEARYRFVLSLWKGERGTPPGLVLDCACGTGYGSEQLARGLGADVVCGDLDRGALEEAARRDAAGRILPVRLALPSPLPFRDGCFDLVVSFETLEHLCEPSEAVASLAALLADDGVFVVSVPNAAADPGDFHNPYHRVHFVPSGLEALLKNHFKRVRLYGQHPARRVPGSDEDRDESAGCSGRRNRGTSFLPLRKERLAACWRALLLRAPVWFKDIYSLLRWGRSFYPSAEEYEFLPERISDAGVVLAVCRDPRRKRR